MPQMNPDDVNIDPNVTSGTELAAIINRQTGAHISIHSGATRPAYATLGTWWADDSDPTDIPIYIFDGDADILVWRLLPNENKLELAMSVGAVTISATEPPAPAVGSLWYNSTDGGLYLWEGSGWIIITGGGTAISDTPPDETQYQIWIRSTDMKKFMYYDSGTNQRWVEM